jgi:AraC-like DNA-binding protein
MRTVVTTDSVPQADRFDHWAHETSKVFGSLDSRPMPSAPFHGEAAISAVGMLRLCSITAGPLRVRRTKRLCAVQEEEYYKVALQVTGACLIEQDGMHSTLGPGDIAICDTSRPYSFTYERDFHTVLTLLPRSVLPVRPDALRGIVARRITADTGVGAVVGPFLRSLAEQSRRCAGPAAGRLADGTVSLVTALVTERLDRAGPATPQDAMMLRVLAYIEQRLADPSLSPDSIAEAHGISRRYLFKLFAAEELTVAGFIRSRRLERCARDLANSGTDQTIGLVAARWGLPDHRHFSRVFKAAYGVTPTEFRRQAPAGTGHS